MTSIQTEPAPEKHATTVPSAFSLELKHASEEQQKTLENIIQTFEISDEKLETMVKGFAEEMARGLEANDPHCDMKMIPSWVTGK
jgi:hexokinase